MGRRPERGGGSHSGSPLGWGGPIPLASGGVSRRGLLALVPGGGLRYPFLALFVSLVRSLPARACGRGWSAAPGWGGVRGGPSTAPMGVPADLQTPPLSPRSGLWLREGHAGRGLLRVPLCALLRHAGVGSREQVQPPLPLPCRRPSCGWGRPPGPGGAEGRACGSPAGVGAGGGGAPPPALGSVWKGGGGEWGGPSVPWRCLLSAKKGGGRLGGPGPGGQPSARGVAPFPRPPLPRAGFSRSLSLGPLIPRPLSRGAGRPGVAVRVSGQWLAGCGAAGFPPRLLSPHSPPREVARRFPWVGNKAGVTGVVLSMGGVATHTIPVRAHPASLGTICAASRCAGVGPLVLRGPHLIRRLGRGGESHSGSPLGRGGVHPLCLGGWGPGPPWLAGRWGGGGGGVSRRGLPALVPGGGLWYAFLALSVSPARSLPARACGRG